MNPAIGSSQNESALSRGKAMSAAPSISGTTKFARPANAGMMKRKIISDAWTEKRPLYVCGSKYWIARLRELGADEQREHPAGEEEEDRRDEVLDADHLVVGVDPEVVAPALGAVAGVVFRAGREAERVVHPVVEGADAGEEADRRGDEGGDEDERLGEEDRVPAGGPRGCRRRSRSRSRRRATNIHAPRRSPGPSSSRRTAPRDGPGACWRSWAAAVDVTRGSSLLGLGRLDEERHEMRRAVPWSGSARTSPA